MDQRLRAEVGHRGAFCRLPPAVPEVGVRLRHEGRNRGKILVVDDEQGLRDVEHHAQAGGVRRNRGVGRGRGDRADS